MYTDAIKPYKDKKQANEEREIQDDGYLEL